MVLGRQVSDEDGQSVMQAVELTEDHKPDNPIECRRINEAGGRVDRLVSGMGWQNESNPLCCLVEWLAFHWRCLESLSQRPCHVLLTVACRFTHAKQLRLELCKDFQHGCQRTKQVLHVSFTNGVGKSHATVVCFIKSWSSSWQQLGTGDSDSFCFLGNTYCRIACLISIGGGLDTN